MGVVRAIFLVLINLFIVLELSLLLTWQLRAWFVPDLVTKSFPVNFVFDTCPGSGKCSFLSANVSVSDVNLDRSTLVAGLNYDVWLDMRVFDDHDARTAGMFMIHGTCRGIAEEATFRRSATLTYHSGIVYWLRLASRLPLILIGFSSEDLRIKILLFRYAAPYGPGACRRLQIELQTDKLNVFNSFVHFIPTVNFFYYYSYYWPKTSFLVLFSLCCFILLFLSSIYWLLVIAYRRWTAKSHSSLVPRSASSAQQSDCKIKTE